MKIERKSYGKTIPFKKEKGLCKLKKKTSFKKRRTKEEKERDKSLTKEEKMEKNRQDKRRFIVCNGWEKGIVLGSQYHHFVA